MKSPSCLDATAPIGYHTGVFAESASDFDILAWEEADTWHFRVVEVRGGRDAGLAAEGEAPTEAEALAAADAEVARLREERRGPD